MQKFLKTPTFDKKYIFKNPSNLYENFCNAYAYYMAVSMRNPSPKKQDIFTKAQEEWKVVKNLDKTIIENQINNYLQTPLQLLPYLSLSSTSHSARLNETSSLSSISLL